MNVYYIITRLPAGDVCDVKYDDRFVFHGTCINKIN